MAARGLAKSTVVGTNRPSRPSDGPDTAALGEAWRLMHYALRAVIAEPDRILATRGLTRMHHRILFFVARAPGMSVGALQGTLNVTKQALNAPLRQLQTQGLIDLSKADHDARVRELRLTADGTALEATLTGEQYRLFAEAFAAAGPEASKGWQRVMRALATQAGMP
ncbi:MAG: winged helix-turn-helix transcriptional regulator [Burkholderiales bacterium]|nr:winged helix-turn-helix transcriptional regulator [Burkholderiales bacterium]